MQTLHASDKVNLRRMKIQEKKSKFERNGILKKFVGVTHLFMSLSLS